MSKIAKHLDYLYMRERKNKEFQNWLKNVIVTKPTPEEIETAKRIREIEAEYSYDGVPANVYTLLKNGVITKEQIYG